VSRKLLQSQSVPKSVALFVRKSAGFLFRNRDQSDKQIGKLQEQYKSDICNALMALDLEDLQGYLTGSKKALALGIWSPKDLLPSLAAAAGNLGLLKNNLYVPNLLPPNCELFPNALGAAIATNQIKSLQIILDCIFTNTKGKDKSGSWEEMRSAARMIGSALRLAVLLHKTNAGRVIFSFLNEHREYRNSMGRFFVGQLVNDCMRYGNVNLICGAFIYEHTGNYDPKGANNPAKFNISPTDEVFLFKHGHPSALRALLKHGLLDPNHCNQTDPPLQYALSKRNYDMARILLECGADVDGVSNKKGGQTALCHAAQMGYTEDVKFLLEHGADPFLKSPESAYDLASGHCYNKCSFLLKKIGKHGKEYLGRSDLWDIYEDEREQRHWSMGF